MFFGSFDGVWLIDSTATYGDDNLIKTADILNVTAVRNVGGTQAPEPSVLFLVSAGLAGLALCKKRV